MHMSKLDRFDLEESIMNCWSMVDDVRMIRERVATEDEVIQLIKSVEVLYQAKFEELFLIFEKLVNQGEFGLPPAGFEPTCQSLPNGLYLTDLAGNSYMFDKDSNQEWAKDYKRGTLWVKNELDSLL